MKFAIDARFMLRPLRGIPLYTLRLCQNLPRVDQTSQFFYFINKGFEHNDKEENYLPRIKEIEDKFQNVTFVNLDNDAEIFWEQVCLPRLVKQYSIDLLHMPANRVSFKSGVKTVVTVHDMMEYLYLLDDKFPISWGKNRSLKKWQYNARRRLYAILSYKWGIARSEIITVSKNSRTDIARTLKVPEQRITVIHHGVDNDYLTESPLPREQRKFTLMLGGDSYQKNPAAAIAAWSQVDKSVREQSPLRIVGFCGDDASPLLSALREHDLEGVVDVRGWISQEEMVQSFRQAALFLFPSRYEGFGFPPLQAMACGTPVVSTNRSSIPEVLGPVGFQYDPDDHAGMAQSIERVLSDPVLWAEQSRDGAERACSFTWENSAQAHLDVYSRILGQSSD